MTKDNKIYLNDILRAIESIEGFLNGVDFEKFSLDDKTFSAVVRKLEIIGEATKQISEELRKKYTQVPWKDMAGMRDRLIHFYAGVDYKLVWQTVQNELPKVKKMVNQILKEVH